MSAAILFRARLMHFRRLPKPGARRHRFSYSVFRLMFDIDGIERYARPMRWFSVDRFNLVSFHRRDHGPRDGSSLRHWVEARLAAKGIPAPARIDLYCFPRVLGYVFNPLSAYLCRNEGGRICAVVYEVRNTDGDLSPYVFDLSGESAAVHRHGAVKDFYVSPFISADQRYGFTLHAPGPDDPGLRLRIRVEDGDGLTLIASEHTDGGEPLSDPALLRACAAMPFMTLKVIAGIYWEAVRLRLKGAPFFRHPGGDGRFRGERMTMNEISETATR